MIVCVDRFHDSDRVHRSAPMSIKAVLECNRILCLLGLSNSLDSVTDCKKHPYELDLIAKAANRRIITAIRLPRIIHLGTVSLWSF